MTYDVALAERVRDLVRGLPGVTEKRMFGGCAFLVDGHLAVSASGRGGLLVRVAPAMTDELVARPGVDPFVMRGRAVDGWLAVSSEAVGEDAALHAWVERGVTYARSLTPGA